ncbi:MAG: hypothetical protein RH942_10640 [Kiloniellaceae bacterium]
MKTTKQVFSFPALLATAVCFGFVGATPASAEDNFSDWDSVANQVLAEERGEGLELDESMLAAAAGLQYQVVTYEGVPQAGAPGTVNLGTSTFAGQVMSTNVINSGNNSVFQTQTVIAVTIVDSVVTP